MESFQHNSGRPFIRVAASDWLPYSQVYRTKHGHLGVKLSLGNLLEVLAAVLDFNYEVTPPPDGLWGQRTEHGNWTGMVGMLDEEEAEFALGPFTMTPDRDTVCDFTFPVDFNDKSILTIRPKLISEFSGFLKPFSIQVWLLILVSSLSIGCFMIFTLNMEAHIFSFSKKYITGRSIEWVLTTIAQESSVWMPSELGGRILVTTWLLATLVFMSSYSGILTAMLTLPRVNIPIDSLADLVAQSEFPWKLVIGSMSIRYLAESEDPSHQAAFTGHSGFLTDCFTDARAISNGEFAAICDERPMMKAMHWDFSTTGSCHLYITQGKVMEGAMNSVAFKRNSSYLDKANNVILKLTEAGIMTKWIDDQTSNASECMKPPSSDHGGGTKPLGFRDIAGPLMLALGGLLLGLLTFIVEKLTYPFSKLVTEV